jgi:hypothetical protein
MPRQVDNRACIERSDRRLVNAVDDDVEALVSAMVARKAQALAMARA